LQTVGLTQPTIAIVIFMKFPGDSSANRRERRSRRDYLKLSFWNFSAFSHRGVGPMPYGPEAANSAVNYYVSSSIKLGASIASGGAET
jgi:hypothetical protein